MLPVSGDGHESLYSFTCVFPWALDVLRQDPNCVMTDGTFRSLNPYTLAILHAVFANETIPIAFSLAPSESLGLYNQMYEHIIDLMIAHTPETDRKNNMLTRLPLVSDMGLGLKALVKDRGLKWYICHCHIIRAAGAKSRAGRWASRLLKCCSPEEYDRVRRSIEREIDGLYKDENGEWKPNLPGNLEIIRHMLDPNSEHEFYGLERWARWLRLGCPTTSNAGESVHGHLNAGTAGEHFLTARLRVVIRALRLRYLTRNAWVGTAITRNHDRLYPSEQAQKRHGFSAAKVVFLRRLHARAGKLEPDPQQHFDVREMCTFPLEDGATVIFNDDVTLPSGWTDTEKREKHVYLNLDLNGEMSLRRYQAMVIARDARAMDSRKWDKYGPNIFAQILSFGEHYGEDESRELSPEEEGEWRARAWEFKLTTIPD